MARSILFFAIMCVLITQGVLPVHAEEMRAYVVQPGDTLIDIAMRYGVSVSQLAAANELSVDAWVYVGQRLMIPSARAGRPGSPPEPASRFDFLTDARVPYPLPSVPVIPQEPANGGMPATYARVIQDDAPVYGHPSDAIHGLPPKRRLGVGFIWVSVQGQVTFDGQDFFQINPDEYVMTEALSLYQTSTFQGVALAEHPQRSFAWILQPVQPALAPGSELAPESPVYGRYDLVQIFATERLTSQGGDQVWYLIGPHQWINQIYVGKVVPSSPPEGIEADAAWIEVNLFEQTLAAYEGDRMVYATLISSGLPGWDTPTGLFQTWLKVRVGKMSGAHGRSDYYFLEDVRWTMYFNKDVALHTAYWHDGFGYKHSHGCVNLAPLDAQWLFDWAPEDVWVWVHSGQGEF